MSTATSAACSPVVNIRGTPRPWLDTLRPAANALSVPRVGAVLFRAALVAASLLVGGSPSTRPACASGSSPSALVA